MGSMRDMLEDEEDTKAEVRELFSRKGEELQE